MCELKNIENIRKHLKEHLHTSFYNYQDETNFLIDLFNRTVRNGESNSALLIGASGSGKTHLVNHVLQTLNNDKHFTNNCFVVKLNGIVHVDDRQALKSISTQLAEKTFLTNEIPAGTFADNLRFLLSTLTGLNQSKSLIFILEQFDLFCSHHNQSLLYNLFDVAQRAQVPLCVLGVSAHSTVADLLEKRVKSRFSHRRLTLTPNMDGMVENWLRIQKRSGLLTETNVREWNRYIDGLVTDKDVKERINMFTVVANDFTALKNVLFQFTTRLTADDPLPTAKHLSQDFDAFLHADHLIDLLTGLSTVELCLMIAIKHHCEVFGWTEPFSFDVIYTRYKKYLMNLNTNIDIEPRHVLVKAFERLGYLGLIVAGNTKLRLEHQAFVVAVNYEQIVAAVKAFDALPTTVLQWLDAPVS